MSEESRRFEARSARSNKFWEITENGNSYVVRFGRIGSSGREQRKTFETEQLCHTAAERKISEKLRKGYVEVVTDRETTGQDASSSRPDDSHAELGSTFTVTVIGLDDENVDAAVDVEPLRDQSWEHPEWIEEARVALASLGYRAVGHARISTLPRWRTLVLTHEERACYAVVYDDNDGWLDLLSALPTHPEQPVWLATRAPAPLIGFVAQRPTYFAGVQLPHVPIELLHEEFLRTRPPGVVEPVSLERLPSVYLQAWELDLKWAAARVATGDDVSDAARPVVGAAWARARELRCRDAAERLRYLLEDLELPWKERRLPETLATAAGRGDLPSVELFLAHDARLDTVQADYALRYAAGSKHPHVFDRIAAVAIERGWSTEATISMHRQKLDAPVERSELGEILSSDAPMLLMGQPPGRRHLDGQERQDTVARALELAADPELTQTLRSGRHERGTYLGDAVRTGEDVLFEAILRVAPPADVISEALIHAADHRHARFVERLLRAGADPRVNHEHSGTALIQAAMSGDLEIVERLLAAGADPRARFRGVYPAHHHTRGPFTEQINAALRRAAKAGARGRGTAVRFLERKKALDPARARGVAAFQFHLGHPEWSVIFAQASPEDVAHAIMRDQPDSRWQSDTANRRVEFEWPFTFVFRLRGNDWTIVLRSIGWIDGEEYTHCAAQAEMLSRALSTRVVTWLSEDTSCVEEYRIYDDGEPVEYAAWDGELQRYESVDETQPKFAEDFPEPVFSSLGIFLPACHIDDDGLETKLVLHGLQPDAVERVDVVKSS